MTAVTSERIARLNDRVRAAAGASTEDQGRLLAQVCKDTCELLRDWLDSDEWTGRWALRRPVGPQPTAQDYLDLLDRALGDTLTRAARLAGTADLLTLQVDDARAALRRVVKRHPLWGGQDLLDNVRQSVTNLRNVACDLARRVPADEDTPDARAWRADARRVLGLVRHMLPAVLISIVPAVSPPQIGANLDGWYHLATRVVATCLMAEYAPRTVIAPEMPRPLEMPRPSEKPELWLPEWPSDPEPPESPSATGRF